MIFYPINRTDIYNTGVRFDAGYHLSEGMSTRRTLTCAPMGTIPIADASKRIFYGVRANRIYVSNRSYAIPFLTGSSIMLSDFSNTKLVSQKLTPAITEMTLKEGWIMISRSGTVGLTAWSNKLHAGKYGSEDIIRIIPNNRIRGGVIYSYLASRYGQSLLTQGAFGAVVQHIEPDFVGSLPIPIFPEDFQKAVNDLVLKSAHLREHATILLDQAKEMLGNYLNVNYKCDGFKTSTVSSKKIWQSLQHRLDPPALMNNGVEAMNDIVKRMPNIAIKDIKAKVYRPGIFKRIYVADGIPYIKGSEIFLTNPFRRCEHLSRTRTPFIDEMTLYEGQILITCAGSCGNVKMITKEYEDKSAIGSQDIIRLVSYDTLFTGEYLFVYLQQPFVYGYIQSMKYGSVIERIEPFHVESIPVVKPTKKLSEEITAIIKKYKDCTYKAFCAEEKAIQMVEQEIEKWNR